MTGVVGGLAVASASALMHSAKPAAKSFGEAARLAKICCGFDRPLIGWVLYDLRGVDGSAN